jgi:hypothetical protein
VDPAGYGTKLFDEVGGGCEGKGEAQNPTMVCVLSLFARRRLVC